MFFHKQYPLRVLRGHRKKALLQMTPLSDCNRSQEVGFVANDTPFCLAWVAGKGLWNK